MNNNYDKIIQCINGEGVTLEDITKQSGLSRNTVRVYIERMIGEKKITIRNIGNAKLVTKNAKKQ